MSRAARLKADYPVAATMLEKIAGGIYIEGMESLTPLLIESMNTLTELLPAGSMIINVEPERGAPAPKTSSPPTKNSSPPHGTPPQKPTQ